SAILRSTKTNRWYARLSRRLTALSAPKWTCLSWATCLSRVATTAGFELRPRPEYWARGRFDEAMARAGATFAGRDEPRESPTARPIAHCGSVILYLLSFR